MSQTKLQLVDGAYAELAIAGYDFDITPEEYQWALGRLDGLMATWAGQQITLPFAFGAGLDADSGLPLTAEEAVVLNLACRLAAGKGKTLASSTKAAAKQAFDAMLIGIAHQQVQPVQYRTGTPSGQGNRANWGLGRRPFLPPPDTDPLQNDGIGLTFNGS